MWLGFEPWSPEHEESKVKSLLTLDYPSFQMMIDEYSQLDKKRFFATLFTPSVYLVGICNTVSCWSSNMLQPNFQCFFDLLYFTHCHFNFATRHRTMSKFVYEFSHSFIHTSKVDYYNYLYNMAVLALFYFRSLNSFVGGWGRPNSNPLTSRSAITRGHCKVEGDTNSKLLSGLLCVQCNI